MVVIHLNNQAETFPTRCPFCGGVVVVERRELWEREGSLAVIITETVGVYRQCGEYFLSPQTVERLERLRQKLPKGDWEGMKPVGEIRAFTSI